jgi:nucleotide sugar dehydrogenase
MSAAEETIRAFENRSAVIGVLGLGYAGLPLACMFAEAGFSTVGFEVNRNKVEQLNRGDSYIGHLPADRIKQLVKNNALRATCDFESLQRCDAVIICVPTPLAGDGTPDLSLVRNAAELLARHLHRAQLIVLESTTYPGTTDELVLDILTTSGLKVGVDYFISI